jgi:pyruvate formate lyase activating enzyme
MTRITRRRFLHDSTRLVLGGCTAGLLGPALDLRSAAWAEEDIRGSIFASDAPGEPWKWSHEAFRFRRLDKGRVMCEICPNYCVLAPGDRSVCRSKVNCNGVLYSLTYGNPCAVNVDPIEKKPLYHFKPGTKSFSIAAAGCNFRCLNCQNWEISQAKPHEVRHEELFPAQAVSAARQSASVSIAYTYSEPISFYEYMRDTSRLARAAGLSNLLVSNGYINPEPLVELCRTIDAANINLKSYDDRIYRRLNGGRLEPVLNTLKTLHEAGVHLEITTLVVPGYVDDEEMIKRMCAWVLQALGPDHPHHFTRFWPRYKLDRLPPTPVSTLTRLRDIARAEGLHYVYVGNVPEHEGNHTYCHACGKLLIARRGYFIPEMNLSGNRCKFCGAVIPGVWT